MLLSQFVYDEHGEDKALTSCSAWSDRLAEPSAVGWMVDSVSTAYTSAVRPRNAIVDCPIDSERRRFYRCHAVDPLLRHPPEIQKK